MHGHFILYDVKVKRVLCIISSVIFLVLLTISLCKTGMDDEELYAPDGVLEETSAARYQMLPNKSNYVSIK
jgi:hypothetical protein